MRWCGGSLLSTLDDVSDEDHPNLPSSSRRQQKKSQRQTEPEEDEYEDEEQLATVSVVEDFDPDTIIHGPRRVHLSEPNQDEEMTVELPRSTTGKSRSTLPSATAITRTAG